MHIYPPHPFPALPTKLFAEQDGFVLFFRENPSIKNSCCYAIRNKVRTVAKKNYLLMYYLMAEQASTVGQSVRGQELESS